MISAWQQPAAVRQQPEAQAAQRRWQRREAADERAGGADTHNVEGAGGIVAEALEDRLVGAIAELIPYVGVRHDEPGVLVAVRQQVDLERALERRRMGGWEGGRGVADEEQEEGGREGGHHASPGIRSREKEGCAAVVCQRFRGQRLPVLAGTGAHGGWFFEELDYFGVRYGFTLCAI